MGMFPKLVAVFPMGVGLCLLFGLWTGQMGNPPFMFKVFGSFIAFFFMTVGFGFFKAGTLASNPHQMAQSLHAMTKELKEMQAGELDEQTGQEANREPKVGYDCPNCGATLGKDADVSPSGDVKCGYCERWFNIHGAG